MTIYNKKGKPYTLEGVYCRHCLESASSSEENDTPVRPITTKPVEDDQTETSQAEVFLDDTKDSIHQPLLEETRDVLANKQVERVSWFTTIKSLFWLHYKLVFCDWKRLILPIILSFVLLLAVRIAVLLSVPYVKCEDGSYVNFAPQCIDNNNPPTWTPSFDAYFFESKIYQRSSH